MNETVLIVQAKLFTSNYTNGIVHVIAALLSIVYICQTSPYFWLCSFCKQSLLWLLLRETTYTTEFVPQISHSPSAKFGYIVFKCFDKYARVLNLVLWVSRTTYWNSIKKIRLKAIQITIKYDKIKAKSASIAIKDKNSLKSLFLNFLVRVRTNWHDNLDYYCWAKVLKVPVK